MIRNSYADHAPTVGAGGVLMKGGSMEYNGTEIPDSVIIEQAKELGYIKMPTWGTLYEWVYIQHPDHLSERDVFPVANYIFDQLLKGGYE